MEPKLPTPRHDYEWTDSARETVRAMWANGDNMDKIAGVVGCSRGAIAGLINRMGLQKMPKPRGPSKPRPNMQTINARAARMHDEPPAVPVERHVPRQYVAEEATRKPLLGLSDGDCRWPCWNAFDTDQFFCGAPKAQGWVYCAEHGRIAYRV